jgi:uncharacterized membrane protein YesL
MDNPLSSLKTWLVDAFRNAFDLFVANGLWLLFTVLVVTAPPAFAGLYYATNRLAHGEASAGRAFFDGFRQLFWLSWRWAGLNILVIAILISNYLFYNQLEVSWNATAQSFVIATAFIWFLLQCYTFPLLIEQSDRRVRVALRNSLVLYIRQPIFSASIAIVIGGWLYLCARFVLPAWFLITASLAAYFANRAVMQMLEPLLAEGAGAPSENPSEPPTITEA